MPLKEDGLRLLPTKSRQTPSVWKIVGVQRKNGATPKVLA